jgi:hypothetical protein
MIFPTVCLSLLFKKKIFLCQVKVLLLANCSQIDQLFMFVISLSQTRNLVIILPNETTRLDDFFARLTSRASLSLCFVFQNKNRVLHHTPISLLQETKVFSLKMSNIPINLAFHFQFSLDQY